MLRQLIPAVLLLAASLGAATRVAETLYNADGTAVEADLEITPMVMAVTGNRLVLDQRIEYQIINGVVDLSLEPNAGSSPEGTRYNVRWRYPGGRVRRSFWVIPDQETVTVSEIDTPGPIAPPIWSVGGTLKDVKEDDVVAQSSATVIDFLGVDFDITAASGEANISISPAIARDAELHNQSHVIDGADHTASGLTIGQYIRATGATAFSWQAIIDGDLPGSIARDSELHGQGHAVDGADHTASGLTTGHVFQATGAATFGFAALLRASLPPETESELQTRISDLTNIFSNNDTIGDVNIANDITLDSITQITTRPVSSTTGELAASRVGDGGAASTQPLFSGGGGTAAFRAIADGDLPSSNALDSELHAINHDVEGGTHTASGLTVGNYLRATAATTFSFDAIADGDLPATIARDAELHPQSHILTGGDHTASGLTVGHVIQATGATTFAFQVLTQAGLPSETEAQLEARVSDATDIFTNNDGTLADDDLSDDAITALSDVGAKSGSGTTVLFQGSPNITTPTIASFTNSAHDHQAAGGGGQLDHGLGLTGLLDDDHTQYARLAGRATGQTLQGGVNASDALILESTADATKGIIVAEDPVEIDDQNELRLREEDAGGDNYVGFRAPAAVTANGICTMLDSITDIIPDTCIGGVLADEVIALASEVSGVLPDANVANDITLDSITQITTRPIGSTTGDLAAARVADGGVAATQALFSGAGSAAGFRAIVEADVSDLTPHTTDSHVDVEENDVSVQTDAVAIDFLGADFDTSVGAGEVDVSIAAGLTRDGESPAAGDVSGSYTAGLTVGDDSHAHGDSTIDSLDASATTTGAFADARVDGSAEADELVLAGDVDGTANANDIDELAVEAELEAVLDLPDLQGTLGTGQAAAGFRLESEEHAGTDPTADLEEEAHSSEHKNGGGDEVATATPAANAIPKAEADGDLANSWIGLDQTYAWTGAHTFDAGATLDPGLSYGTGTGIKFGDGDMEIYESADDQLRFDPGVDSATAFQFLDAGGTRVVSVNTLASTDKNTLSVHGPSRPIDSIGNVGIFSTNSQGVDLGGSLALGGLNGTAGVFDPWSFVTIVGKKENSTSSNLAGYFAIATSNYGGTIAEMFRITSTGKVGVGIDAPTALLHVENDTPTTGTTRFLVGQGAADSDTTVLATIEGAVTAKPGGSVPACELYTKTVSDLTTFSVTEDEVLFNLPARGKLTGVSVKHTIAFSGGTLSAMSVSVGDSSSTTFYTAAFDVFQGVADTTMQDTDMFKSSTNAARDVLLRFTAVGATVDNVTAGSVGIAVCWVVLP